MLDIVRRNLRRSRCFGNLLSDSQALTSLFALLHLSARGGVTLMDDINSQNSAAVSTMQQKLSLRTNSCTCQLSVFTGLIAAATMIAVQS